MNHNIGNWAASFFFQLYIMQTVSLARIQNATEARPIGGMKIAMPRRDQIADEITNPDNGIQIKLACPIYLFELLIHGESILPVCYFFRYAHRTHTIL